MTREDDDPRDLAEDDEATRSMRSVWLAMREEAPPSSGLAELMAAARSKAAEMKPREPWWQRVLATLRRPPVLALATVILLVGGAVIIGKRRTDLRVEQMAPGTRTTTTPAAPPVPDLDSAAPAPAPDAAAGGAPLERVPDRKQTRPRPRRIPAQDPRQKSGLPELGRTTLEQKLEDDARPQRRGAGHGEPPAADTAGEDSVTTRGPRPVTVAQLVEQSAAAAARGDCATVKSTAERIRKLNPAVYTEQVANNAAIAKCLR